MIYMRYFNLRLFKKFFRGFRRIHSESGFTIMEGVVAAGLLAGLSVAVVNLSKNLSKASRKTSQDMSVNSLRMEVFSSLKNPDGCSNTLLNLDAIGDTVPVIQNSNGGTIITSGGVYGNATGNAQSRVQITGIDLENYSSVGATYSSPGAAAAAGIKDRINGTLDLKITFQRGDRSSGRADEAERKLGGGSSIGYVTIPVKVVTDVSAARNILSCISTKHTFVDAFCDSFDGDSNYDEKCRHLTLQNRSGDALPPATDYSANFRGNVIITDSDITANAGRNHLYVYGSVGVGIASATGANEGHLFIDESISVGSGIDPPGGKGDGHFESAVGVGVAPAADNGSLMVNSSAAFGSGFSVPALDGALSIEKSLGIGVVAPNTAGDIQVTNHVGVLIDPTTSDVRLSADSISVGGEADPGSLNVVVGDYVNIPNQAVTDSNATHVATQNWVSTKVANTLNPDVISSVSTIIGDILGGSPDEAGASAICQSFRVQNAKSLTDYSDRAALSGSGCLMEPVYCSEDDQCTTVYAEASGLNSDGSIIAESGDITTASGHINVPAGTAQGDSVVGSTICLPDNNSFNESSTTKCKTSWASIKVVHGSCYSVSAGGTCGGGYFVAQINVTKQNLSPVTSVSHSSTYYAGGYTKATVSSSTSTYSVMNTITYSCCKAKNE